MRKGQGWPSAPLLHDTGQRKGRVPTEQGFLLPSCQEWGRNRGEGCDFLQLGYVTSHSSCHPLPTPPVPSLAAQTAWALPGGWLRAKGLLCFGAGGAGCQEGDQPGDREGWELSLE